MTPQRRTTEIHDLVRIDALFSSKGSEGLAAAVQAAMMEGRGTDHDASDSTRTANVTGSDTVDQMRE